MKKIAALLLIAIILLSLSACGNGEDSTIYYPLSASPHSLDPQFTDSDNAEIVINNCFEGLLRTDKNNNLCAGVAESWDVSEDNTVYTFHLRNNSKWKVLKKLNAGVLSPAYGDDYESFDTTVTADDFVFAFQRAVDPQTNCPNVSSFFIIKNAEKINAGKSPIIDLGVAAPDKFTLVITLENSRVDFLERLTEGPFMPCSREFFELTGGRYGLSASTLLCNGPFYVSAWDPAQSLTLTRNSVYGGTDKVCPSAVSFSFNSDPEDIAERLTLGKYSAAVFSTPENAPTENVDVTTINDSVTGFCFNCADEVLCNENIRLALCCCIAPASIPPADTLSRRTESAVPECCMAGEINYHNEVAEQIPPFPVSSRSAAELWNKGLTELDTNSVTLKLLCKEEYSSAMRSVLQSWQQALGISLHISIEILSENELEKRVKSGDYQLAFAPVHSPSVSVTGFLKSFTTGNYDNIFNMESPEYDSVIARLPVVDSEQEILNTCFTAERYLVEHGIFIPVFDCPTCFVQAKGVQDIVCSPSGDNILFMYAKRFD